MYSTVIYTKSEAKLQGISQKENNKNNNKREKKKRLSNSSVFSFFTKSWRKRGAPRNVITLFIFIFRFPKIIFIVVTFLPPSLRPRPSLSLSPASLQQRSGSAPPLLNLETLNLRRGSPEPQNGRREEAEARRRVADREALRQRRRLRHARHLRHPAHRHDQGKAPEMASRRGRSRPLFFPSSSSSRFLVGGLVLNLPGFARALGGSVCLRDLRWFGSDLFYLAYAFGSVLGRDESVVSDLWLSARICPPFWVLIAVWCAGENSIGSGISRSGDEDHA